MPSHKMLAAVIIAGAGYELYNDYKDQGSTLDWAIDGAIFFAGCALFF